jgi:hypothetical protein
VDEGGVENVGRELAVGSGGAVAIGGPKTGGRRGAERNRGVSGAAR